MKSTEFLSEQELLSGIYTEVKEIKNKLPDRTKEVITDIGFINNSELCRSLHISKKTAAKWRRIKLLRFTKIGGMFYYRLADVKDMLQQGFNRN
jgi:hypothetical protein